MSDYQIKLWQGEEWDELEKDWDDEMEEGEDWTEDDDLDELDD